MVSVDLSHGPLRVSANGRFLVHEDGATSTTPQDGPDWVLVLDDAARALGPPGVPQA